MVWKKRTLQFSLLLFVLGFSIVTGSFFLSDSYAIPMWKTGMAIALSGAPFLILVIYWPERKPRDPVHSGHIK